MAKTSPRVPHLLIGGQMLAVSGYAVYYGVASESLVGMAAAAVFALWAVSVGLMALGFSYWPHRFPSLSSPAKAGWKLRLPHMNKTAARLGEIGFQEIGVKQERTLLIAIRTRELWHPEHRTYASLTTSFAGLFVPAVTFITQGEDGRIVYTGRSVAHRRRHLVARAGIGATVEERFEDHLRALRGEELVPMAAPEPEHHDYRELGPASPAELMAQRLELTREWYVVSFASDAQWDEWLKGATSPSPVEEFAVEESGVEEALG